MPVDDITPDDSDEPEYHQVGQEYPVEYTGCFICPLFEVRPGVPEEYVEEYGGYRNGMAAWVEDEQPLMGPDQFKEYVLEQGKQVFQGSEEFRVQSVIKGTAVTGEHVLDKNEVEYGFQYLVAFYYSDTHWSDGDLQFRRAESLMMSDLERWEDEADVIFKDTPYNVTRTTLVPTEAGTPPLDPKHEDY